MRAWMCLDVPGAGAEAEAKHVIPTWYQYAAVVQHTKGAVL